MDQDFKYVIQDFSHVYIGARLRYEELVETDDSPQRLNSAIFRYFFPEDLAGKRICDHIMEMQDGSSVCQVYAQMKAQMKLVIPQTRQDKKGNEITEYKTRTMAVTEFVRDEALRGSVDAEQITEIICSKLHLMSLHV